MHLSTGTKLGPYEIRSPLGAGGMGEVYLARDTKLDRDVAIKVLPEAMTRDPERVARFEREAKLLAVLNHASIAGIYGFDDADGMWFLVMEYVDGETLAQRLARGSLAVDDALDVARQMAEALEAAHEKGIVHRDLKPGNVMVRDDGSIKVLDFGLAKAIAGDVALSHTDIANSPTITADYTRPGVVLGTAAYMSPEQARGKPVDRRSDIWSFGCILYELLTGARPFDGATASDVMARILERDPDLESLPANTPPKIIDLIRRCLEKDQRRRLRDIGDALLELEEALATRAWTTSAIAAAGPAHTGRARRKLVRYALCVAAGALVGVLATMGLRQPVVDSARNDDARRVTRLSVVVPEFIEFSSIRIAPDGSLLAAIGRADPADRQATRRKLYVRSLEDFDFRALEGTDGVSNFCFSPDSQWLALTMQPPDQEGRTLLSKIAVDGSTALLPLKDVSREWTQDNPVQGPRFDWTSQGQLLSFNPTVNSLVFIDADTGAVTKRQTIERDAAAQVIIPVSEIESLGVSLFSVSSYEQGAWQMKVMALSPEELRLKTVVSAGSQGVVTSTGHLVYSRGQRLLAVPFDAQSLTATSGPVAIMDGLRTENSWVNGDFALSKTGTLVYAPGGRIGGRRRLTIVDEQGTMTDVPTPPRPMETSVSASRDGKRATVVITNASALYEMWLTEIDLPRLRRLASEPDGDCLNALWNWEHDKIAYEFEGGTDRDGIYVRRADGTGDAALLALTGSPDVRIRPLAWAPGGRILVIGRVEGGRASIHLLRLDETDKPETGDLELLLGGSFDTAGADLSPDGKWLAYGSDESGRTEIYIRSFHADGTLGAPTPVTSDGGGSPRWSPDGDRLYYMSSGRVMIMTIDPESARPTSEPRIAVDFDVTPVSDSDYSVLPDGKLLMIRKGPDEARPTHVNVVLNWFEELKAKVPLGDRP